ncbi:hypothetical protein BGY98DRAFT_918171, partial [Russula aff. rugulosa BPL654]
DICELVVKFTAQYHPEAHRLLATEGLAPVLYACVPVCGGLFIVVMDLVHGELAWEADNRGELRTISTRTAKMPSCCFTPTTFGNLRTPNIMDVPGGSDWDARCRGMLIDFDWVGTQGISRYPGRWSPGLGVIRYPAIWDHGQGS